MVLVICCLTCQILQSSLNFWELLMQNFFYFFYKKQHVIRSTVDNQQKPNTVNKSFWLCFFQKFFRTIENVQ